MPLYDDIIDAFALSPAGGSVTADLVGATLQTNEIDISCNPPGWSVWLKVDLSALVGSGNGKILALTGATASGAILPEAFVMWDPTGTFDPAAPDFDIFLSFGGFLGDGTATPPPMVTTLNPDSDSNPSGIYWIGVGNYPCDGNDGTIDFSWPAFTDPPPEPHVQTDPADNIDETSVRLHGTIFQQAIHQPISYHFEYGPTIAYGSTTPTFSVNTFTGDQSVLRNVFSLSSNTTYHFRIVGQCALGHISYGEDRTFTTLVPTGPSVGVTLDPTDFTTCGCVTFNGTVDPDQADTDWLFRYALGVVDAFGPHTPGGIVPGGSGVTAVHEKTCRLIPGRRYRVRIEDANRAGGTDGAWVTFNMPMCKFGMCTELVNDFDFGDCSNPEGGGLQSGEDTLRVKDGQIAALHTTAAWIRGELGVASYPTTPTSVNGLDAYITLATVAGKEGLLIARNNSGIDGYYGVRHDGGNIILTFFDLSFAETTLASGPGAAVDGDKLGIRWEGTVLKGYLNGIEMVSVSGVSDFFTYGTGLIYGEISNDSPFDLDLGACVPTTDSMGQITSGEIPICCDLCTAGMNKYEWLGHFWQWNEHGAPWAPPIASGGAYDPCPGWRAYLDIYPHGRFDCFNTVWSLGGDGDVDGPHPPWYVDPAAYNVDLTAIETAHSFFVYDGDYAHKIFGKLLDSLESVVSCDSEAVRYEGVAEGFPEAFQVWRPVDFLPARMDNLFAGIGCPPLIVGFSKVNARRRTRVSIRGR